MKMRDPMSFRHSLLRRKRRFYVTYFCGRNVISDVQDITKDISDFADNMQMGRTKDCFQTDLKLI